MYKYVYVLNGDFNGIDFKYNYQIDVRIPVFYHSKAEAEKCQCSVRFEKENNHVVLRIYSGWEQGFDESGCWFEGVKGNIIDTIKWDEWWKYQMTRSKKTNNEMGMFVDGALDYQPDATLWDDLFDIQNQPDDWHETVEPQAYRILIEEVKDDGREETGSDRNP